MARRAAIVCAVLSAACGGPAPAGKVSASIALLTNGQLAVVNGDQGSVSLLDAKTLAVQKTIDVGGRPHALLQLQSGALWVTTHTGGNLVEIDVAAGVASAPMFVCPGSAGLAESHDGSFVAIACEWSGQVMRVDPKTKAATVLASGLARPRAVATVGSAVIAADFPGEQVHVFDSAKSATVSLVPSAAPYRPALTKMTANLAEAVVPAFGHLFVAHELVNHTGDDSEEKISDDYGNVLDGASKINAAVTRLELDGQSVANENATPPTYSRFDATPHAVSGPVALASFGSKYLLVANVSTNDVAMIDSEATDQAKRLVATWAVGAGPSGIAVDEASAVAYVDNAFDGSISVLDLTAAHDATAPLHQPTQTLVRSLVNPFSATALAGRKLFYDASNPHVTPSRVVACATCHPGGGDDGLIWFMHTGKIPLKRRRTPHLANANSTTAPFHWDGQFATMTDLVNATVTDLMAGDDLLVDATTVQAFVDEIVEKPEAPAQDAAAVQRGQAIFDQAGCGTCHSDPSLTDNLLHAVLTPESLMSDDAFTTANTPALHGLFMRAPFFHDGRSKDLRDLLTRSDAAMHTGTTSLTASQLDDLVVYLESL